MNPHYSLKELLRDVITISGFIPEQGREDETPTPCFSRAETVTRFFIRLFWF